MDTTDPIVIVGSGLCGASAAETLRREGFDGRVLMIGAEPELPYDRPPLSKDVLQGTADESSIRLRSADEWAALNVELLCGVEVTSIDTRTRSLRLSEGPDIAAQSVLLATGGDPRRLPVEGSDLDGVLYLRSLGDALAIREFVRSRANIVVVGAGFIGAEVAASARLSGCSVTLLEAAATPLSRVLTPQLGAWYAEQHAKRGVEVRLNSTIESIEGGPDVKGVRLRDGGWIDADCVVIGIGMEPRVDVAQASGIEVSNGIVVDEYLRTSQDGVFAAGDACISPNPFLPRGARLESWANAREQGAAAAKSMLGLGSPYEHVPWVWSDQYDLRLQLAGHATAGDDAIMRGDLDTDAFTVLFHREGIVTAAVGVNTPRDVRAATKLIQSKRRIAVADLADSSVALHRL